MKNLLAMVVLFTYNSVLAGTLFAGSLTINRMRVAEGGVYFGASPKPANTCNSWGDYFKFDHKTETGKAFLGLLIAAKTSGQKIQLWYTESTAAPGADQASGCNDLTISVITGVALQ